MQKKSTSEKHFPPTLITPRNEVKDILQKQVNKGKGIQRMDLNNGGSIETASIEKQKWIDYVAEILVRFFDNDSLKHEFLTAYGPMRMAMSFADRIDNFQSDIQAKLTKLESIVERLDLIPEKNSSQINTTPVKPVNPEEIKDVFIVHGHDNVAKMQVASFIRSVDLNPIILHEQANGGKTLIEKLEHYSGVGFAVVIMTPDDMGYPKDQPEKIQPRARQNVITELGFFVGKLSRTKVAVLYTQGVELPTDFLGVVYIPFDTSDGWKFTLSREIKNAGIPIDLNKAL